MKTFILRWGPAAAVMAIIFAFSSLPKDALPDFKLWEFAVKKTAHLIVYALLAAFMLRGVRGEVPLRPSHVAWALALTLLYAFSDEYHQTFVPGRGGRLPDVAIDAAGATIGLSLRLLWNRFLPPIPFPSKSGSSRR